MARAGIVRAEGEVVTSANTTDRMVIQRLNATSGQYEPAQITVDNAIAGTSGDRTITDGDLVIATAGNGLQIKEGSNARMGTATLASGTVTVANTSVTANTVIMLTRADVGASTEAGVLTVGTVTASTSFVISALDPSDASVATGDVSDVNWVLIEPAA
jgi:hypothetical protein